MHTHTQMEGDKDWLHCTTIAYIREAEPRCKKFLYLSIRLQLDLSETRIHYPFLSTRLRIFILAESTHFQMCLPLLIDFFPYTWDKIFSFPTRLLKVRSFIFWNEHNYSFYTSFLNTQRINHIFESLA